jgi:hypothetical protein
LPPPQTDRGGLWAEKAADKSRASPARLRWCMYFIVVWTSAWPIHAWTWTIVAWSIAIDLKVCRRSWNRSLRSPACMSAFLVAAAQRGAVEVLGARAGKHEIGTAVRDCPAVILQHRLALLGQDEDGRSTDASSWVRAARVAVMGFRPVGLGVLGIDL